jgi:hypothetical protein
VGLLLPAHLTVHPNAQEPSVTDPETEKQRLMDLIYGVLAGKVVRLPTKG